MGGVLINKNNFVFGFKQNICLKKLPHIFEPAEGQIVAGNIPWNFRRGHSRLFNNIDAFLVFLRKLRSGFNGLVHRLADFVLHGVGYVAVDFIGRQTVVITDFVFGIIHNVVFDIDFFAVPRRADK